MSETTTDNSSSSELSDQAYLAQVMVEIDEEVRLRRATGDLPPRIERELDELFLEHSPIAGREGSLADSLRMVDAAAFIDPVVPIESAKSGGAVVKKGMRKFSLWYVGYVTHQVSQLAAAVSRSLHAIDDDLTQLRHEVEGQRVPPAGIIDVEEAHRPDAWWVETARKSLVDVPGRVLHAACGNGWLVTSLNHAGIDAYGIDPRPGLEDAAESAGADLARTDLRQDDVVDHLRAVASGSLGGLVLTGVVEGLSGGEREQLLTLIGDRLAPDGSLVLHSISPAGWLSESLPPVADLAPGRPLRSATWSYLLGSLGYSVSVHEGPSTSKAPAQDYVVTAVLTGTPRPTS